MDKAARGPCWTPGPRGSWDERGVADPVRDPDRAVLLHVLPGAGPRAAAAAGRGALRATASAGRSCAPTRCMELGGPGAFDEAGLGEPAVWSAGRASTGCSTPAATAPRTAAWAWPGRATACAGRSCRPVFAGARALERAGCSAIPRSEPPATAVRVWFGGGDVASPDENLHGQIGLAVLRAGWC